MSGDSEQVKMLKAQYLASFSEKANTLVEHAQALQSKQDDALMNAHNYLHKLAGSSGMYGFSQVASECRAAMNICESEALCDALIGIQNLLITTAEQ